MCGEMDASYACEMFRFNTKPSLFTFRDFSFVVARASMRVMAFGTCVALPSRRILLDQWYVGRVAPIKTTVVLPCS